MPTSNKRVKEDFSLIWIQLPVAAITLVCTALLFLALFKNDIAAWVFLEILVDTGCVACAILSLKVRKNYLYASAEAKPKRALILSFLLTGLAVCASIVIVIITLIQFIV